VIRHDRHQQPVFGEDLKTLLLLGLGTATLLAAALRERLPLIMIVVGAAFLCAAAVLGVLEIGSRGVFDVHAFQNSASTKASSPALTDSDPVIAGVPASAAPSSAPGVHPAVTRLVIPAIAVNAPVVVKGIDDQHAMETPDGPAQVAWYDFSSRPGTGGNAVFAGHVDYKDVGPAVFWRLEELKPGDLIEAHLDDGTTFHFRVTSKETFDATTAPVKQIVGPTSKDSVTLITCTGQFDWLTQRYDQRLVVRAELVPEP
jgi:LPXTG-site transpeptidase (sortase) family protein